MCIYVYLILWRIKSQCSLWSARCLIRTINRWFGDVKKSIAKQKHQTQLYCVIKDSQWTFVVPLTNGKSQSIKVSYKRRVSWLICAIVKSWKQTNGLSQMNWCISKNLAVKEKMALILFIFLKYNKQARIVTRD